MLTAFILGIALGSLTYTLFHPGGDRPLRFFAYVSLGSVLLLLACLPWYDRLPFYAAQILGTLHQQRFSFAAIQTATLGFCLAVMLPLTFLSGLSFPALAHAAAKVHAGTGRPVSYVMAANTGGTIAGTVVGGLVLLPQCGLQRSFLICVGLTLCLLTVVLLCDRRLPRPQLLGVCLIAIAGFASYLALMPRWDLRLLTLGEFRRHEGLAGQTFANYYSAVTQKLLYYRDGASATVSVDEWPAEIVLRVNGKADASAFGDRETQMLLAHIPLVLRPHAEHALIIGYGSGMTAGALLRHPLKSIDVVEISPEVIDADRFFRSVNGDPLRDARTHVAIEDARTFLYQTPQRYDAIISEPSNPWIAGVSNLFTVEFFQQVKSRLRDDGVFVQWFHMYETSDDVVRLILRTLAATFPEVRGFVANGWDIILVASVRPVRLEPAESQAAFARATDLAAVDLTNLHDMLCLEIFSNDLLRQLAGVGELNRDRRPLLEYAAPRAFLAGAESQMIARTQTFGLPGYLVDPNQLSVSELRALGIYLQRFDLLPYMHTVRFLAAWYRQAPLDPALHESLAKWSLDRGGSPVLIRALAQTADTLPADTRHEHAQGLLRALGAILPRPTSEQIEIAELSIAATAAATGDRELLTELENQKKRAAPATLSNGG
jgi:spermidine synthase